MFSVCLLIIFIKTINKHVIFQAEMYNFFYTVYTKIIKSFSIAWSVYVCNIFFGAHKIFRKYFQGFREFSDVLYMTSSEWKKSAVKIMNKVSR